MSLATTSPVLLPPDRAVFEKNLSALADDRPETADYLRKATAPPSLMMDQGRDEAMTFTWTDETGCTRWLGRTTMPTVRARVLVAAFHTGEGNVLLAGFGQGAEVDLLRRRLLPHQAIMVVDEDAWAVACVLRLYDFSDELRDGRLLVFVGETAWADLERFLIENEGFVEPQRILSWPWFDAADVAQVSQRLTAVNSRLTSHRDALSSDLVARTSPRRATTATPILSILSTIADSRIRRGADVLKLAAQSLGWDIHKFVLDNPAKVHPFGIRRALNDIGPSLCLLLDVTPSMLPYPLPNVAAFVLCTRGDLLTDHWLGQLGTLTRLGVVNETQRRQAIRCGVPESNILVVAPAAQTGLESEDRRNVPDDAGIIVVADGIDPSAEAAGLHLASHRRLWDAATAILARQCDQYDDEQADNVLRAAERQAKVKLNSEQVRAGLLDRIRKRLGPAVVRMEYLKALCQEFGEFDLYGEGWGRDDGFAGHYCGPWPSPRDIPTLLPRYCTMISLEPVTRPWEPLLDGIAAGLHCLFRATKGSSVVSGVDLGATAFMSRAELIDRVRKGRRGEEMISPSRNSNEPPSWAHRLQEIVQFCLAD